MFTHLRMALLTAAACLCVMILYKSPLRRSALSFVDRIDEPVPIAVRHILSNGASPRCSIAAPETAHHSIAQLFQRIALDARTIPRRPRFSLLSAWFKPEAARLGEPPRDIPPALLAAFTLNGSIPVKPFYFNEVYLGGKALSSVWTVRQIDELRAKVRQKVNTFNYDAPQLYEGLDAWRHAVTSKRGIVVGSETPWAEAMLLEYGAVNLTTLEFGAIDSQHPQVSTYIPSDFKDDFWTGKVAPFDFAFTFSTIEHDGLGRYGDMLNPIGDLQTMAKLLTVVKPGGFLFLGIPCCVDELHWNAHRMYGPLRLPLVFAGWTPLAVYESPHLPPPARPFARQPFWVLQNTLHC